MDTREKILKLMENNQMTKYKLAKEIGISNGIVSDWANGKSSSYTKYIGAIARIFNVSVDYLLGTSETNDSHKLPKGAIPVDISSFVKIPIIGSIRCGEPLFEESNIEGYEYVSVDDLCKGETYFYLRAKGDSMINAGINQGDLLLIRAQSDVDNGDIAVVNVNGDEETLKRVIKKDKAIILQPENTAYETKIFIGKELSLLHIQGRLMQVVKKY
ncbi:MAG: LexA family transcriptional regulator [Anaerotignaceae bacterium]